jgi:hypothetical protein
MAANAIDVKAPVGELLSRFSLRLGGFDLIENPTGDIPDFADEFSHVFWLNTHTKRVFRLQFSIPLLGLL